MVEVHWIVPVALAVLVVFEIYGVVRWVRANRRKRELLDEMEGQLDELLDSLRETVDKVERKDRDGG